MYYCRRWWNLRVSSLNLNAPLTVSPDVSIQETINLLSKEGFDQVPVMDADGWVINGMDYVLVNSVRETNACPLANASAFWAGRVENWPEQVEFCIEHIRDTVLGSRAPEI